MVTCPTSMSPVFVVRGELDAATGPALADRLRDSAIRVLDLSQVTFIDASGLRAVLVGLRRPGRPVELRSPSPCVQRIFEIVDLSSRI